MNDLNALRLPPPAKSSEEERPFLLTEHGEEPNVIRDSNVLIYCGETHSAVSGLHLPYIWEFLGEATSSTVELGPGILIGLATQPEEPEPAVFRELEALRRLAPNWDSYGAPRPAGSSIDTARQFLRALVSAARTEDVALPAPSVQASGAGTVGFAWGDSESTWSLEVEAHPDGVITFVQAAGDQVDVGTVETAEQILEKLRD